MADPNEKYKRLSSEIAYENPFWVYKKDKYVMPNGETGVYHYVYTRGSTFVIPKKSDNTFVMNRQYRYLNKKFSVEFPGGGLEKHLAPEENALKELAEETGYGARSIKEIGEFNPYNGVAEEICKVFLAEDLYPADRPADDGEEFEIYALTESEIIQKIKTREIWDGMTLAAWSLYLFG